MLGTLTTSQSGNATVFEIFSNDYYSGNPVDEMRCFIQFTTSQGTQSTINGADNTPFYGAATMISTKISTTNIAIQQNSNTSYSLY